MAERYFGTCECGQRVRVELFDAGTRKVCPSCRASVPVPNSAKLLESSGDPYPFLRPIEKVCRTLENGAPPFDGVCHSCSECRADWSVPITFDALVERHMADDGGIRPTLTGGIRLVAGAADEHWQRTTFPLLLCSRCYEDYRRSRLWAEAKNAARLTGLAALLGVFLYFAVYNMELVAALAGVFWLIGAFAWATRFRRNKKIPAYLKPWLDGIRWVPDAIAAEDEFRLSADRPKPIA